jgi:hypothetical protein
VDSIRHRLRHEREFATDTVETLESSLVNRKRMGHIGAHRISEGWKLLILKTGDGDRTRDVQLGNPKFNCKQRTYAFTSVRSVHIHPRRFSDLR